MRNFVKILLLPLIFAACTETGVIRNLPPEKGGYLLYGKNNLQNFYEPVSISDSLKLKWEASTHGSYNNSSVVAYENYIITHDLSGFMHCFNKNTGEEIGVLKYEGSIYSTPVIYKSRIFFVVNNLEEKFSTAYYYDLSDGKVISTTKMQGSFTNQTLKIANAFFVISNNGEIYQYNFAGVNEWKFETGVKVYATSALEGEEIIIASSSGEIVNFNYKLKKIIAKKKIGAPFLSGVVVAGSDAFSGDAEGVVYCFNPDNCEVKWKAETKNKISALPVCDENFVYATNLAGYIYCFNRKDGSFVWKTKIGGTPVCAPLLFKNYLIIPNLDSYLYILNTSDGMIHKKMKFSGRMKLTPVYFDGLLIFGNDKGNISAYEVTELK